MERNSKQLGRGLRRMEGNNNWENGEEDRKIETALAGKWKQPP
jgi:hypothetical protein